MEPSVIVSIVALFVSLSSLFISWKTYNRDNSDLRVSLDYWLLPDYESRFNVRATNHGRRVVLVERMVINFRNGSVLQDSIAGGKPVTEAEPFDHQLPIYDMDDRPLYIPTEVKSAEAFDTLGRCYKFPRFTLKDWLAFRRLKAEIRQKWADEQASLPINPRSR